MVNRPALTIYLSCIYIHLGITPIKPVYSQPLSVTVPVVIGTGVGWYGRVCTCTATKLLIIEKFKLSYNYAGRASDKGLNKQDPFLLYRRLKVNET